MENVGAIIMEKRDNPEKNLNKFQPSLSLSTNMPALGFEFRRALIVKQCASESAARMASYIIYCWSFFNLNNEQFSIQWHVV